MFCKIEEKFLKRNFVLVMVGLLGACATPARMSAMVADVTPETVVSENSPLINAVELASVSGGETTNPLWTSEIGNTEFQGALNNTLTRHVMLAKGDGRFRLTVQIMAVDQPIMGASFTVTATVRYTVTDKSNNTSYFDETIAVPYTAAFSDAFLAYERLRLANEGAVRVNIERFIKELIAKSKSAGKISLFLEIDITDIRVIGGEGRYAF